MYVHPVKGFIFDTFYLSIKSNDVKFSIKIFDNNNNKMYNYCIKTNERYNEYERGI